MSRVTWRRRGPTVPPGTRRPDRDRAPVVRCEQVSVRFGARTVLDAVCCAVDPGQRVAVMGPSGSGKTTLLHVLAGLQPATGGAVRWPTLGSPAGWAPGTVMVSFQAPSLVASLDAAENVALPLVLAGVPDREARQRALAELAGLDLAGLAAQLPEELSGGQAQRVSLARALAARPVLLLADEPTGQLDGTTGMALVRMLVERAHAAGSALVVATHDPQVQDLLDTRWSISDGRLDAAARR
ncbi:MAG TPA: ATP-binding cassette domain-containing protein [Mycobacteriales bacterium]|nr:ATP-binding cassette domain-containing protein [Mycobacteriales bacterium]